MKFKFLSKWKIISFWKYFILSEVVLLDQVYKTYIDEAVKNGYKKDEEYLKLKYLHSLDVLIAGREIVKDMNLTDDLMRKAEKALLLHDIGRVDEYKQDKLTGVNHGLKGGEILSKSNVNNPSIVLAVKYHNVYDFKNDVFSDDLFKKLLKKEQDETMFIDFFGKKYCFKK